MSGRVHRLSTSLAARGCLLLVLMGFCNLAVAQAPGAGVYHPANPLTAPGLAGQWMAVLGDGAATEPYFQPIRFQLPSRGLVTFYASSPQKTVSVNAPAQAGFLVGRTYRLRVSGMPEFPGIELYPSIEVLGRLHPPAGKKNEFPVPVVLAEQDIQMALQGRLITRVVYLEQPQLARPVQGGALANLQTLPPSRNLIAEADRLGRPMLILRLGGRIPTSADESDFFVRCPPIAEPQAVGAGQGRTPQEGVEHQ